jgi:hypothetical protein
MKKKDAKRIKGMQEKERENASINSKECWKKIEGC